MDVQSWLHGFRLVQTLSDDVSAIISRLVLPLYNDRTGTLNMIHTRNVERDSIDWLFILLLQLDRSNHRGTAEIR